MKNNNDENQWLGVIPNDWKLIKGKYLFKQRSEKGNNFELQLLSPTQKYGIIPQSLYEKLSGFSAVKLDEKTDFNTLKTIHKGDYCISLRSFQGGLEYSEYEGVCSPAYQIFFPIVKLCTKYYKYLFKVQCFIDKINSFTLSLRDGKNIAFADFASTYLPYPPLDIQEKIADFLDKECSEIDALHTDIEKQIETLEEYKKSIITEAVTKGLDPDVEMKDSGIEWVGMIPKHWNVTKFKYICSVKTNLVNVKKYQEYPQISPDNIEKDSGILLNYSTVAEVGVISDNHLFFKGQILYSKIRPKLNKATIAPFNGLCSADMYPIETNENTMFVLYMILSQYFLNQVSLVTEDRVKMPKINQEELGVIKIVLPDNINEQEEIVLYLHQKCQDISKAIEEKKEQLETLEQYKKSLIYEYVTGKKEVK